MCPPDELGCGGTRKDRDRGHAGSLQGVNLGTRLLAAIIDIALLQALPCLSAPVDPRASEEYELLAPRKLTLPIRGLGARDIRETFAEARPGGKPHEATDILAPRGTPVVAVEDGVIQKLFLSKPGGITIYEFDRAGVFCYYYAHLDRYAAGLMEGMPVKRGDVIGYVGTTGNAPPQTPHLHFAIFRLGPEKHWWEGVAIDPYPVLVKLVK